MYIPNTPAEQREMLERIGVRSTDELFDCIPPALRFKGELDLPPALTEMELGRHMEDLAGKNRSCDRTVCFLGGGCYDHFVPAAVDAVASRSEYYTAYTPYQAEASQGTLQVGFEFQTLMCQLSGLDVANASMYEAATAVVEAALMASAVGGRREIVVSEAVHPEYRQALATYLINLDAKLITIPAHAGSTDLEALAAAVHDQTACVVVQHPNFFGLLEPMAELVGIAKKVGAAVVQAFDPISLGVLRRPGEYGVDVAVAEGQSLGTPLSYGGPFLGIFACREKFLRKLPGRVVGQTVDRHGRRAFVLTLQTREQHIRREKATSNICTNQGLLALRASVYLSLVGPQGLKELGELCWRKAHYAADQLGRIPGLAMRFPGMFFKEFVLRTPGRAADYLAPLVDAGFHAGVPLGKWHDSMEDCLLVAVTERRTKEEIDALAAAWRKVLKV